MDKSATQNFFIKRSKVYLILSLMVVCLHVPSLNHYSLDDGFGVIVESIISFLKSVSQVAVPLFFLLSGAVFFRDYTLKSALQKYKNRIKSLVVPYLVWNLINMLFEFICSYTFISNYFVGREKTQITLQNVLKGIFLHEYSPPFWFVQNLIIFILLAPVFYMLLKNKIVGGISIASVTVLYFFGIKIPETIFYRASSIIFFMVGAYIGIHYFSKLANDIKNANTKLLSAVLFFAVVFLDIVRGTFELTFLNRLIPLIYLAECFFFWQAIDLIKLPKFKLERYTFVTYAMHNTVVLCVAKLISLLLPQNSLMAALNWCLTYVISVSVVYLFCVVFEKLLPKFKWIIGIGNK